MRHTTFNFNRTKTKIDTYPDTKEAQYMRWIYLNVELWNNASDPEDSVKSLSHH